MIAAASIPFWWFIESKREIVTINGLTASRSMMLSPGQEIYMEYNVTVDKTCDYSMQRELVCNDNHIAIPTQDGMRWSRLGEYTVSDTFRYPEYAPRCASCVYRNIYTNYCNPMFSNTTISPEWRFNSECR